MRILHYVLGLKNGGIENLVVNLANKQVALGNEVAVMVLSEQISSVLLNKLDRSVQRFLVMKPLGSKNPYYLYLINMYYRKYRPDVFHLHNSSVLWMFPKLHKTEKRFVTMHSDTSRIKWSRNVNKYIAISETVKQYYEITTGHKDCVVCYNGIVVDSVKQKHSYNNRPHTYISVGRLDKVKGFDFLIEAFAQLKIKGYDFRFEIWGDGLERDNLQNRINELSLNNEVILFGDVDNAYVNAHLSDFDVFIQASRHEGLGIASIEAMVAGIPVLLSNTAGLKEVSNNGRFATLFEVDDIKSFVDSFIGLDADYSIKVELARQARLYAIKTFSIDTMARNLSSIYDTTEAE